MHRFFSKQWHFGGLVFVWYWLGVAKTLGSKWVNNRIIHFYEGDPFLTFRQCTSFPVLRQDARDCFFWPVVWFPVFGGKYWNIFSNLDGKAVEKSSLANPKNTQQKNDSESHPFLIGGFELGKSSNLVLNLPLWYIMMIRMIVFFNDNDNLILVITSWQ